MVLVVDIIGARWGIQGAEAVLKLRALVGDEVLDDDRPPRWRIGVACWSACLALSRPGVDGVVGTADILDDLLLLGALDGKLAIGSMNRGGLASAVFELDDRFTGYSVPGLAAAGLDGGKMLLRVADDDAGTAGTLAACAAAVEELARAKLLALVEPLAASRAGGNVAVDMDPDRTAQAIAIAAGLGSSSAYTWLKVPAGRTWPGSCRPPPCRRCCSVATWTSRPGTPSTHGGRCWSCRPCAGSSPGAPCCTPRTATSRARSMRSPPSSPRRRHKADGMDVRFDKASKSFQQVAAGVTTLYVTHDQVEAMTMADQVAVLERAGSSSWRRRRSCTRAPPTCSWPPSAAHRP
jgi:hypothetical protein